MKVQARVLRTIDKCGGLDEYLLGEKAGRIKELGVEGWRLRWLVMRTGKVRRRVKGQKEAMGLVGVGKPATSTQKGNSEGRKARVAATLEDEVKRASREVIEEIDNTPSSQPTPLIHHINLTTRAISAETAHRLSSQTKTSLTNDPDDNNNPTQAPGRRYTKGEKRAWRAEQASKRLSLDTANGAGVPADKASALMAEVARIEEVVEGEMEGMEGAGRERLEVAMEMLRGASEELERVMAGGGAEGMGKEKGTEGGVLGRIKGLFARR